LSKKKAEGTEALVLDVKYGSGAFMKDAADGEALARSLVDTGAALGLKVIALLTDMDEPLGNMVGNFLEIEESLDCLEGKGPEYLMEVTLELAARMVMLGGKAADAAEGRRLCERALAGGKPKELFLRNVKSQGGDPAELLKLRGAYRSPITAEIKAAKSGYISRIDAWKTGRASVSLGVGRNRTEDKVCPTAGIEFHAKRGGAVKAGDPLMTVWAADEDGLRTALPQLAGAVEYSDAAPLPRKMILKQIG
jgi:pyrimidine-nucleoside phosphorylase